MTGALIAILLLLVVLPLAFLIWSTFYADGSFTSGPVRDAYAVEGLTRTVWASLSFALGAILIAMPIGVSLAYLYVRTNVPFKTMLFAASLSPLVIPGILYTISWIFLASPRIGLFNDILEPFFGPGTLNIYGIAGMATIEGLHIAPLVFLLMVAAFRSMDPALEESALVAGARLTSIVRRITLPMVRPALAGAALIMGVKALESFEVPVLVGLPGGIFVFTSRIWQALNRLPADMAQAGAYSLSLLALTGLGVFLHSRFGRNAPSYQTLTGQGRDPKRVDLGRWRWPIASVTLLYFLIAVVAPVAMLVYISTQNFYSPPSLETLSNASLDNYVRLLTEGDALRAMKNSVLLGIGAATVVMLLMAAAAWIVIRGRLRGRWLIDGLASLPLVIPGLVLAVALLYVYLRVPLAIYGTAWILLIAYVTRFLPYGMRYASTSMHQVAEELEESAEVAGATGLQVFRRIHVPLLMPGLIAGWLYIVSVSMRELSSSILLYSPGNETLSVVIWEQWANGRVTELAALGVVMVVALLVIVTITLKVGGRMRQAEG